MPYTEEEKKAVDEGRFFHDYLKHLTTLSSGSILIVATFLDRLFPKPAWKSLVAVAIISFLVSLTATVFMSTVLVVNMGGEDDYDRLLAVLFFLSVMGFVAGMISLGAFTVLNLF
jgi:hypothetical protein